MKASFLTSTNICSNIWTFYFKPESKHYYIPGQFIELKLDLTKSMRDKDKRWFTLSSSPSEKILSISTRIDRSKMSDYKKQLSVLKPGDYVDVSQAMGDFVLPKDKSKPLLFVAFGIGITPYRSIIKWLLDQDERRDITLIHVIHNPEDKPFADLFEIYPCNYQAIPNTMGNNKGSSYRELDLIAAQIKSPGTLVYMSGPEQIVEDFRNKLVDSGHPEHLVIGDYFPGYKQV